MKILVVEDDALNALLLIELLTMLGHTVCPGVATEQEAVRAARRLQPDLMIVDARLDRAPWRGVGSRAWPRRSPAKPD